jgi:hypothetical protein
MSQCSFVSFELSLSAKHEYSKYIRTTQDKTTNMKHLQKTKIQMYEMRDDNHPANIPYAPQEDFDGIVEERFLTDALFTIVFLVVNLGLGVLIYFGTHSQAALSNTASSRQAARLQSAVQRT